LRHALHLGAAAAEYQAHPWKSTPDCPPVSSGDTLTASSGEEAMAHSAALIDVMKRELKARGITYEKVARHLGLSVASVKRMFSRRDFTLKRLDEICALANTEFSDLARSLQRDEPQISSLTHEQEEAIVADKKLFLVAVCVLNHATFEQIVATYDVSEPECIHLLTRLDHLKFIELQPNNRIKLLVSRTFSWLPDGPIQRFFKDQAHHEFFRSDFHGAGEFMLVVNGMLAENSSAAIVSRLKRVASEFSDLHNEDVRLPLEQRSAMSLLVAVRHWELEAFAALRRKRRAGARTQDLASTAAK
jgi:transcriptional regulator with XRE-family HTH domain